MARRQSRLSGTGSAALNGASAGSLQTAALGLLGTGLFIALWAVTSSTGWVSPAALPSPASVAERLLTLIGDLSFWREVGGTMTAWFFSMCLSLVIVVPIGLAIAQFKTLRRPIDIVVNALRSVPATSLVPIAILMFRLGTTMKLALAMTSMAWPVLINTMYGAQSISPVRLEVARSLNLPRRVTFARIVFPNALPQIATGMRVASGISLVVIISAELLGASGGVGVLLRAYQQGEQPDFVYAGIFIVGVIGTAVFALLDFAERKIVRWENV